MVCGQAFVVFFASPHSVCRLRSGSLSACQNGGQSRRFRELSRFGKRTGQLERRRQHPVRAISPLDDVGLDPLRSFDALVSKLGDLPDRTVGALERIPIRFGGDHAVPDFTRYVDFRLLADDGRASRRNVLDDEGNLFGLTVRPLRIPRNPETVGMPYFRFTVEPLEVFRREDMAAVGSVVVDRPVDFIEGVNDDVPVGDLDGIARVVPIKIGASGKSPFRFFQFLVVADRGVPKRRTLGHRDHVERGFHRHRRGVHFRLDRSTADEEEGKRQG